MEGECDASTTGPHFSAFRLVVLVLLWLSLGLRKQLTTKEKHPGGDQNRAKRKRANEIIPFLNIGSHHNVPRSQYDEPLTWNMTVQASHLRSLRTVELLPHQDGEVTEGQERAEHVTCFVLQSAADQQRIIQDGIVEDGDYLHVLWKHRAKGDASAPGLWPFS